MVYTIYLSLIISANSIAPKTLYDSGFFALIYNYTASILNRFQQSDSCSYNFSFCHTYSSKYSS